ncbi:hypothetical protein U9M48_040428 [Paspalum notatum var. saurae]|uniref:Transposase n=1 Tax=Paspalum notatum var. saurae TaxID=547442 RepID=A0AAQ3UL04_PASNO
MVDRFRGRKSYPTQNVLAVVDFDLRFTYVLAGWEGSAHDSLVLQDALSRKHGLKIPEGKFYLADAGYAARPGILPPYRGVRYHLQEFLGPNEPKCPKELFNLRHSSLRTTIERAFGTLKTRFKILSNKPFIPLKSQPKVVAACCALQNWILDNGPDKFVVDEATWYTQLPRSTNRVSDYEVDIRDWAVKRDVIAQQMWNDRVHMLICVDNMEELNDAGETKKAGSRERSANWSDDETKFMLEWYIELQKDRLIPSPLRKQYHQQCANALNAKFGSTFTRSQVYRNFKKCRERWSWIASAHAKSGYSFDASAQKFTIDPSEKDPTRLGVADGSFAVDQTTVNVSSDSDESDGLKELENYQMIGDDDGTETDTIAFHSASTEGTACSKKRKHLPTRNVSKGRTRHGCMNDEVSASIVRLCDALVCGKGTGNTTTENKIKSEEPVDPNASLWQRIEVLPIPTRDKIEIAKFLSNPQQEIFRGYLKAASDSTFQTWVIDFMGSKYGTAEGSTLL